MAYVREIGPYRVIRRLGGGGFGIVYLASSQDGVTVAVKVLRDPESALDRKFFHRELVAAQTIDSRFVGQVHDHNVNGELPWIAFRVAGTESLAEAIRSSAIDRGRTLSALLGGARGLVAIHDAGLLHRDVSPDNIIVTPDEGQLIDLGIASLGIGSTLTRMRVGKTAYLAPEQWSEGLDSQASDVWQWGVTAAKVLSGHLPFANAHSELVQFRLASEEAADLYGVGSSMEPLISGCLEKEPSSRPSAAALVRQVIEVIDAQSGLSSSDPMRLHVDESISRIDEFQVSDYGRLQAWPIVSTDREPRRRTFRFCGNSGYMHARVGDLISISWSADDVSGTASYDVLNVGQVLSSLRTGDEVMPSYPTVCSACDEPFEGDDSNGWWCVNHRSCPSKLIPRIEAELRYADRMLATGANFDRQRSRSRLVKHLVSEGHVENEVAFFAISDSDLSAACGGHGPGDVVDLISDRAAARGRPFGMALRNWFRLEESEARRLVRHFPTLVALTDASDVELAAAIAFRPAARVRALMGDVAGDPETAEQRNLEKAKSISQRLREPWFLEVVGGLELQGLRMVAEPNDWPATRRDRPTSTPTRRQNRSTEA